MNEHHQDLAKMMAEIPEVCRNMMEKIIDWGIAQAEMREYGEVSEEQKREVWEACIQRWRDMDEQERQEFIAQSQDPAELAKIDQEIKELREVTEALHGLTDLFYEKHVGKKSEE